MNPSELKFNYSKYNTNSKTSRKWPSSSTQSARLILIQATVSIKINSPRRSNYEKFGPYLVHHPAKSRSQLKFYLLTGIFHSANCLFTVSGNLLCNLSIFTSVFHGMATYFWLLCLVLVDTFWACL